MQLFETYLRTKEAREMLNNIGIIFSGRETIWSIKEKIYNEEGLSNHEEADTKVVMFASKSKSNVVVVASDCDILVLLVYAYAQHKPTFKW